MITDSLGTSLAFPLRPDGAGGLAVVSGVDAVEDSITAIINSLKASHLFEPWLGLPSFVLKPASHVVAISQAIKDALINGEDRIDPETIKVSVGSGDLDAGSLSVSVTYSIPGDATTRTLETGYRVLI